MRRLVIIVLAILVISTTGAQVSAGAAPSSAGGESEADGSGRALTPAEVNASLAPPGGIKALQTGGNTVGDVIREETPRADGYRHIDTPATIKALQHVGANTYTYLIWNSPTDWADLTQEFAPAAERAGIDIWLYLVPPSECLDSQVPHESGRCSRPFKEDYVRWAEEIAKLSVEHPNVKAWALDDFFSQLPPEEVAEMQRVQDEINPALGFYTTVYYHDAINGHFYDQYEGVIDGIIYPYTGTNSNTQDASKVAPNLERILEQTEPRDLGVVLLAYTGRYLAAIEPPTDKYIADVIAETRPFMESGRVMGITLYGLPIAGDPPITALNMARSGAGWLSLTPSIFGRTEPGHYAQAMQRIVVNPRAKHYSLEFSDFDVYFDQNSTAPTYHSRQVLVDGEVVWESDDPVSGGAWHRHYVDLTEALRGKTTATLTLRLLDETSLSLWTGVVIDDVRSSGFTVRNGGFEGRGAWALSKSNDVIFASIRHYADYYPSNALDAAAAAFRGEPYEQARRPGDDVAGTAMYGSGRLRLAVEPFTRTRPGDCTAASQVLQVDPGSPRYEIDFFQTSPHTPYPGFHGAHQLTVEIDGEPVWTRDANSVYPFWENGNGLQGPIDVSEFVTGKDEVTLAFRLCGLANVEFRPNPPIDIGFDNLRTVGLDGDNFGFETDGDWSFTSDTEGLSARIAQPSPRPEAPRISAATEMAVVLPGKPAAIPVTITNSSRSPMSGELAAVVPDGWSVDPASTSFGPIPAGESATVPVTIDVPSSAAEGTHWVIFTADSPTGTVRVAERVQVIGATIEFSPGTAAEAPWLVEPDGSQLDGDIFDGKGRFADGSTSFTYRFDFPADTTGGSLTLHIGNQFLVRVSSDGKNWTEVLREDREIRDLSNLADRTLELAEVRDGDAPLYVRVEDSQPADGWGGWLGRLTVRLPTPISAAAEMAVVRAGASAQLPVAITNSSDSPMSGELTAAVPDSWSEPASVPFGPIPAGESATVTVTVDVPSAAAEGSHWVTLTADSPAGMDRVTARVQVIGDTIEFTPGTAAEDPWLVEPDGSRLDGEILDGRGRYADNTTHFTYRFDLPSDVAGGSLTLQIGNQFLVRVSSDGQNWTEVLREDREIRDLSNLGDRTLDLAEVRDGDAPLYVRIEDSQPADGWGGWLGHLTLTMTTS